MVYTIKINSVEQGKALVDDLNKFEGEVDIKEGRRIVDGKSLLGLFSLNLGNELQVIPIISKDKLNSFEEIIKKYK